MLEGSVLGFNRVDNQQSVTEGTLGDGEGEGGVLSNISICDKQERSFLIDRSMICLSGAISGRFMCGCNGRSDSPILGYRGGGVAQ